MVLAMQLHKQLHFWWLAAHSGDLEKVTQGLSSIVSRTASSTNPTVGSELEQQLKQCCAALYEAADSGLFGYDHVGERALELVNGDLSPVVRTGLADLLAVVGAVQPDL